MLEQKWFYLTGTILLKGLKDHWPSACEELIKSSSQCVYALRSRCTRQKVIIMVLLYMHGSSKFTEHFRLRCFIWWECLSLLGTDSKGNSLEILDFFQWYVRKNNPARSCLLFCLNSGVHVFMLYCHLRFLLNKHEFNTWGWEIVSYSRDQNNI